jgi:hypothetical protein
MRVFVLLVLGLVLVAGACGSGDNEDSSDERALAAAISEHGAANPDLPLGRDTTTCLAEGLVAEFGVAQLEDLGVTADRPSIDLGRVFTTPEQAERAFDMAMDCLEFDREMLEFLPETLEIAEESVRCLADGLDSDVFRDLYVSFAMGGEESSRIIDDPAGQASIGRLLVQCLDADELLQAQLGR